MTIDEPRLLRAIAAVEGNNWKIPGGGYQFTKATWYDYTSMPFAKANDPQSATMVAMRIIADTIKRLEQTRIQPTVHLLALRWRYGFAGALHRRLSAGNEYAKRVQNLYEDPSF